jgi:hypothetical protein
LQRLVRERDDADRTPVPQKKRAHRRVEPTPSGTG